MKLLTELSFLRGKELARPMSKRSLLPFPPSSGPGGQCPPGTFWPPALPGLASHSHPATPATPSYRAQRCFSLSLCRLWPPRTLLRSSPGKSAALPWGPCHPPGFLLLPPCAPIQLGHPHIASFSPNAPRILGPPTPQMPCFSSAFFRLLHSPGPSDFFYLDPCPLDFHSLPLDLRALPY